MTPAIIVMLISMACAAPQFVVADTANAPSLTISQLKITSSNGQFITLYNATDSPLDMGKYQLQYFNSYDLTKATSSRLIALTGTLPPHGYYMVNDGALLLCYQMIVDSASLGLSSTAGLIQVLSFNQASPGSPAVPVLQDYVGLSKTAATGAQTLPGSNAFLQRQASVDVPGGSDWQALQPDPTNPCQLVTVNGLPVANPPGPSILLPATDPPVTFLSAVAEGSGVPAPALPAADIGLMAPQITELLPNPIGSGNDATDEFIELYNPNGVSFDLTGFSLQTGLSTPRTYGFPPGTLLPPQSFTAFYADVTKLSLSNSGSQAKLLDPFSNAIAATEAYGSTKDGQAWALGKGKWYWTTEITPSKANIIKEPPAATKKSAGSSKSKAAASPKTAAKKSGSSTAQPPSGGQEEPSTTPIHVRTLAIVGGLALLYGAYEYRTDAANRIYKLRQYLSHRSSNRAQS